MAQVDSRLSTGLPGLDDVLKGLIPGDNIVWQVDSIEDFLPFAEPYCRYALQSGKRLIYFRFASHAPLVDTDSGAEVHTLHPENGFEQFVGEIHKVIKEVRGQAYYIFDSLSELVADWYSDQMLGNFFVLTCPYLLDVEAIAYFPLQRNYHAVEVTTLISETTQIMLEIIRHKGTLHVYPIKVQQRHSPTMYMLHAWQGDKFIPITQSATVSEIFRSAPPQGMEGSANNLDVWSRTFLEAEQTLLAVQRGEAPPEKIQECFDKLLRMAVSRQDRILKLASKYFTLTDLLEIGRRMIGTGLIGGKSVGMLLARAILESTDRRWSDLLESHDSFYVGSDVFYTFLVMNGVWWIRQQQRDPDAFLEGAESARRRILIGNFPEHIKTRFANMLDYFGQSPIIVRSSSLLEDNFGNAFAGKYESVFCVNQGTREKRLDDFLSAVRTIYASAVSEKALTYRAQRGVLDQNEQMALLVQRVSGAVHEQFFYPQIAGVGLSFNPYVWNKSIDPNAGVMRLVFALGTRAVDRFDDDYTRVVALNAPDKRPESNFDKEVQYSQKKVDILDLQANQLLTKRFSEVAVDDKDLPMELFASKNPPPKHRPAQIEQAGGSPGILTFDKLLKDTPFVSDMRDMLKILKSAYDYPLDIEFTGNFLENGAYKINLLQCRPFQCFGGETAPSPPENIPQEDLLLRVHGAVIGRSRQINVNRFIYVSPKTYGQLPISQRYGIARLIGQIMRLEEDNKPANVMLLGPGRWGTSSPSLGVPIHFSEISSVSALCEIVAMHENLVPEVSLGTHVFNEMVEMDILYLALFVSKEGYFLNEDFFAAAHNRLGELIPDAAKWSDTIKVIDVSDLDHGRNVILNADTLGQQAVCFLEGDGD